MFCKCILVYLSLYLHCNFYVNIDNIDDIKAVIKSNERYYSKELFKFV